MAKRDNDENELGSRAKAHIRAENSKAKEDARLLRISFERARREALAKLDRSPKGKK
jgi:hypothetical protein